MSKKLQTVSIVKDYTQYGMPIFDTPTTAYLYTEQEHQAAQGYRDALLEIESECTRSEISITHIVAVAQQALSAVLTTQEECCGRCVGHCYVDNEGEHIELTSLVPRDTNVLDELEKWVKQNYFINASVSQIDLITKIQSLKSQP